MNMQEMNDALNKWANSVVDYFKHFPDNMKKLWEKIKLIPNDEKYAYGAIILGIILIIVAIIIW